MTPARFPRERRRSYLKSGTYTLKKAVAVLGSRALPTKRTALGRELAEWRSSLVTDLGGDPGTAQLALIDLAVRSKLLADSVDAYLLTLPSLVDRRHRRVWPVVRERQALVGQLQSLLRDLGLERRTRDVDLAGQLAQLHAEEEARRRAEPGAVPAGSEQREG